MASIAIEQQIMDPVYRIPSITAYNRLEASPRSTDFTGSLAAGIYDALWMLTRQWQFGEFQGEDAASPVSANILGQATTMDRISQGGGPAAPYTVSVPLEAAVEAETLKGTLWLALQIARFFTRLMKGLPLDPSVPGKLAAGYPLQNAYPIDPNDTAGLQLLQSMLGNSFDGFAVMTAIHTQVGAGNQFTQWLGSQGLSAADVTTLTGISQQLSAWYIRNYTQPPGLVANTSWQGSSLDYDFELGSLQSNSQQTLLTASHFDGGHLDWYDFDVDTKDQLPLPTQPGPAAVQPGPGTTKSAPAAVHLAPAATKPGPAAIQPGPGTAPTENLVSFIPSPVTFKGMPSPRFWTMDDSQTDFGQIDTSPAGLLHLLLAEFGLIYGNDWFMLPYPLPINTLCQIQGLLVRDVFGENVLIYPAGYGQVNSWQNWSLYQQSDVNNPSAPTPLFYLAPAVTDSLEDDPLEQVNFLRDEAAELVWAVEDRVPSQAGGGVDGNLMALKPNTSPPFTPAGTATIQYIAGTTVPDNWIPFIPVHMQGSDTEIQFQRARMPQSKGPLTEILSETPAPYYVREEEVSRAGVLLTRSFRRARWMGGHTFLWCGRTRTTGKGGGWSNLKFDQIVPIPQSTGS